MKKFNFFFVLGLILVSGAAYAEEAFFDDIMVSEEMKQQKEGQSGQMNAVEILQAAPKKLQIDKRRPTMSTVSQNKINQVIYKNAPFGLKWSAGLEEIKALGVRMQKVEVKDSPNTYALYHLPKPIEAFRDVLGSFGNNNALWRIAAYGRYLKDDASASKGVAEYRKYYKILEKKYGNAQEFFSPAIENVEETIPNDDGTTTTSLKQTAQEIGTTGFLQKLISGESTLYATFEGDGIGVTLALLADGDGQTYIIIDYKSLQAAEREDEDLYDAL